MAGQVIAPDERGALMEAATLLANTTVARPQGGLFLVMRRQARAALADRPEDVPVTPSQLRAATESKTWFEVALVDEVGDAVAGAELVFEVDGAERHETTSGAGRARIDDAHERTATVRLADPKALRAKLDARWTVGQDREWIEPLPNTIEVWAGTKPRPIQLTAEESAHVMLHPPQRVRLLDADHKALADLSCSVSVGGEIFRLTSDDDGWIEFPVGVDTCPECATVTWTEKRDGISRHYSLDVVLECHVGADNDVARARLANLGYDIDDLAEAIVAFQLDHELPVEDAGGDEIPPGTREKIADLWEAAHG
jgi:hypothetical protein